MLECEIYKRFGPLLFYYSLIIIILLFAVMNILTMSYSDDIGDVNNDNDSMIDM